MTPEQIKEAAALLDQQENFRKQLERFSGPQLEALQIVRALEAKLAKVGQLPEIDQQRLEMARALVLEDRNFNRRPARPTGPIQPLPPTPFGYTLERATREAMFDSKEQAIRQLIVPDVPRDRKLEFVDMKPLTAPVRGFWASIKASVKNWFAAREDAQRAKLVDRVYREFGRALAQERTGEISTEDLEAIRAKLQYALDRQPLFLGVKVEQIAKFGPTWSPQRQYAEELSSRRETEIEIRAFEAGLRS